MKPIDADILLDKVWDADTRCGYVQVVDKGDIDDAPTLNVWFCVEDRLPEKEGTYDVINYRGERVRYVFNCNKSSEDYWLRCVLVWRYGSNERFD